jgi:septum formation protein
VLVLASTSPRRAELLSVLGVPFEAVAPEIDERAFASPALAKAEAVARPDAVTIGADTEVLLGGERIGKPADELEAVAMLHRLAGREHVVRTEVAVIGAGATPGGPRRLRFAVRSRVRTKERDDDAIARYVATGEALGKAGAYNIHGRGGELIDAYDGCYQNIVGLPLCYVYFALRKMGFVTPERPEPAFERRFGFRCPGWDHARWQARFLWDGAEYESWADRLGG